MYLTLMIGRYAKAKTEPLGRLSGHHEGMLVDAARSLLNLGEKVEKQWVGERLCIREEGRTHWQWIQSGVGRRFALLDTRIGSLFQIVDWDLERAEHRITQAFALGFGEPDCPVSGIEAVPGGRVRVVTFQAPTVEFIEEACRRLVGESAFEFWFLDDGGTGQFGSDRIRHYRTVDAAA